ncbi:hypothetical protein QE152_g7331 [Popillia japonica]|uniref:Uncharacterized protein n=1 Tax=Popillia japonica TaxID=7064 RepID=A0AAW1MG44_POPJA
MGDKSDGGSKSRVRKKEFLIKQRRPIREQDRRETNEDTLINAEEVFKPRNAVMRTPPNVAVQRSNQFDKADANVNVTTERPRSGSSPREQERNKISKHTSTESNTKSNHGGRSY